LVKAPGIASGRCRVPAKEIEAKLMIVQISFYHRRPPAQLHKFRRGIQFGAIAEPGRRAGSGGSGLSLQSDAFVVL
jgi:hypothetical protein